MFYIEAETSEKVDIAGVKKTLRKLVDYFNEKRDFSVTFVDDDEIREMNKEYRGMDNPTDILTFRLEDGSDFPIIWEEGEEPDEGSEMGDIFISLESMRRNAEEFGVSENEELGRLLLHGLLHLRGLDHESNDFSSEPMLIEQEKVLALLGLK